jgi:hypothetical protein
MKDCVISKGCLISQHVIVKEGAVIPEAAVCSELTFDSVEEEFVPTTEVHTQFFQKGVIAYIPRDMVLKNSELISQKPYENEEESDLDDGLEDSDGDPVEDFKKDTLDIFEGVLKQKEIDKKLEK